jgi:hypothetical protein
MSMDEEKSVAYDVVPNEAPERTPTRRYVIALEKRLVSLESRVANMEDFLTRHERRISEVEEDLA